MAGGAGFDTLHGTGGQDDLSGQAVGTHFMAKVGTTRSMEGRTMTHSTEEPERTRMTRHRNRCLHPTRYRGGSPQLRRLTHSLSQNLEPCRCSPRLNGPFGAHEVPSGGRQPQRRFPEIAILRADVAPPGMVQRSARISSVTAVM
jgi:hypothetical protein